MLDVDKVMSTICCTIPEGASFEPSTIELTDYIASTTKARLEKTTLVSEDEQEKWAQKQSMNPKYPLDSQVIAIDTTNFTLGNLPDGFVGAIRASVIIKPKGTTTHKLEHYGPYLIAVTNQNKDQLYNATHKVVYGKEPKVNAPNCYKTLDRMRNFLERHIQLEAARTYKDTLILVDGSLIGGFVGDPTFVTRRIIDDATANNNSIVAIAKSTGLTLQKTQRNILTLLDDTCGPCYKGNIKKHITQNQNRYMGDIYVAKLTPLGEPFRIDIPENSPVSHRDLLNQVAGLAGDYGYPEELKLAHMTCVLSAINIIELQSAAITLHGLVMKEELRPKLFPL